MPVTPPADASTSTSVVAFHSSVPSDSGASVGIVYAETRRLAIGAVTRDMTLPPARRFERSASPRSGEKLLHRLAQDARAVGVASPQALCVRARLLERHMRRQRRHVGIGVDVDDRGL